MDILANIDAQIAAVGLPLYAVTVSAVPRRHTPILLLLHWHGFRADPAPGLERPRRRPVPGSALQLNHPWQDLAEIEQALLEAAWQLGAWDLERQVRRPCNQVSASAREALECRQAFGANPFAPEDEGHLIAEAPDRAELMQLAAARGYVRWQFRPVRGGLWREAAEDDTLAGDGGRQPPCPVSAQPTQAPIRRTVYRLGRVSRWIIAH